MRYLLDTNVLSEFVKPSPSGRVAAWVDAQSPLDFAVSVLSLGEIEKAIARLPEGKRRSALLLWAQRELPTQFVGRVLSVNTAAAVAWGALRASGERAGRPLPVVDGLLLGTAQAHGLTLVTRNAVDCAGRGIPVYDPWTSGLHD